MLKIHKNHNGMKESYKKEPSLLGSFLFFTLTLTHTMPVKEPIKVVGHEHDEAKDHRQIGDILYGGHDPQHDENGIVRGIGQCIIGASQGSQRDGKEAHHQQARRCLWHL